MRESKVGRVLFRAISGVPPTGDRLTIGSIDNEENNGSSPGDGQYFLFSYCRPGSGACATSHGCVEGGRNND